MLTLLRNGYFRDEFVLLHNSSFNEVIYHSNFDCNWCLQSLLILVFMKTHNTTPLTSILVFLSFTLATQAAFRETKA